MTDFPSTPPASPPTASAIAPPIEPPTVPPVTSVSRSRPAREPVFTTRTVIGVVMVLLAGVSATFGVAAFWTQSELLDTDTWVATSTAIVNDPQVQQDVATAMSEQVIAAVGVEGIAKGVLPAPLDPLAGAVADKATELLTQATIEVVRTDAFVRVWDAAVRATHDEFVHAIDGSNRFTAITSDGLALDVGPALEQVNQQLDQRGIHVLDSVDLGSIDVKILLVDAPGLAHIRTWVDRLRVASIVFPAVAVVAGIAGLFISRRRWLALFAGGFGALIGAGIVELVASNRRSAAIDQISGGVLGRGSARVIVDQVMSGLHDAMLVTVVVAVVVVAAGIAGHMVFPRGISEEPSLDEVPPS